MNLNDFAFIDYQGPTSFKNDYRTSYYRGHLYLDETMLSHPNKINRLDCDSFCIKNARKPELRSEIQSHYTRKSADPDILRNPPIKAAKFMKPYEEAKLRSAPKPLQQLHSMYKKDFKCEPKIYEYPPIPATEQGAVKYGTKLKIEQTKPGYAKYLDTSATTTGLDYVPYTADQRLGIGAKDNISYWTWIKGGVGTKPNVNIIREQFCDNMRASKCPKRRNEFLNQTKPVPNTGYTTEARSNYKDSLLSYMPFDFKCTRCGDISCDIPPVEKKTESTAYGERDRSMNFISTGSKKQYL